MSTIGGKVTWGGRAYNEKIVFVLTRCLALLTLNRHPWTVTGHKRYKYSAYDSFDAKSKFDLLYNVQCLKLYVQVGKRVYTPGIHRVCVIAGLQNHPDDQK